MKVNTSDKRKLKFVIYKKAMYTNSNERQTQRDIDAEIEAGKLWKACQVR